MNNPKDPLNWALFQLMNRQRRAIRDFNELQVADEDVSAVLTEAVLAPSSGNLQPYQLHWVRNLEMKQQVALACNGQKAAKTASTLIVVAANPAFALKTASEQRAYIDGSDAFGQKSKVYYHKQLTMFERILKFGSFFIWTPLVSVAAFFSPVLSLLPLGHLGSKHWAARNAVFAAQTLMLAAAAKGIDSCPMEGFSAAKIAKLLELPQGTVIPLVIALGYRSAEARVEAQWRRAEADLVIQH
ncbi:nitroreductase family protein [Rheinheimera sp. 1928-s]|uniref:nitroreductase family protein n=1 Tax=Rheinheimera sp. 1928-s TaxID=3033803 RepID=UPI002625BB9D|nr:nitroreductase family protein [Rheinheimera sp. 1928-s]MDF3127065.1 nitroreductase family protein [Rheinheimera sp. 1928-s]